VTGIMQNVFPSLFQSCSILLHFNPGPRQLLSPALLQAKPGAGGPLGALCPPTRLPRERRAPWDTPHTASPSPPLPLQLCAIPGCSICTKSYLGGPTLQPLTPAWASRHLLTAFTSAHKPHRREQADRATPPAATTHPTSSHTHAAASPRPSVNGCPRLCTEQPRGIELSLATAAVPSNI